MKICLVFGLVIVLFGAAANLVAAQTNRSTYLDFNGDGKTDWMVWTMPSATDQTFRFKILGNQTSSTPGAPVNRVLDFGYFNDSFDFDDYVGDRKTDLVSYRNGQPSIFYVAQFPINGGNWTLDRAVRWGAESDSSAPGDYDGDGKTDYTVVRRTGNNLVWFILPSSTNTMRVVNFGSAATGFFTLKGADFTGDGRDELVVAADINGIMTYYVGDAVTGAWLFSRQWGLARNFNSNIDANLREPADYTGDGKADFVTVRTNGSNLTWYILDPAANTATVRLWGYGSGNAGISADAPVRGDYDGDGRQDLAVYRSSNRTFYVLKSSDNGFIVQQWGEAGDSPVRIDLPIFVVLP